MVTRRVRLSYVRTSDSRAGVRIARVPSYGAGTAPVPPTATDPTASGPPLTTTDPTATTPATTFSAAG